MVLLELGRSLRASLNKLSTIGGASEEVIAQVLNEISRALIESDVSVSLVKQMKDKIAAKISLTSDSHVNKKKLVQKAVQDELVTMLSPKTKPYNMSRKKTNVIMFVGLQGAGKTTTIAKFAGYYARKGWKVSMVCCDSFRAGAFDQLKQNATKLRVPFYGSYTEADPVVIAEKGVAQFRKEKYEIVLIDTSGRHRQETGLFEEMQEISAAVDPDNTVFVMDGTQGQAVYDQAMGFHDAVDVGSVIVTKLDGHAKGGGALSAVAATSSPIIFLGSGEKFDDFEPFNAKSFVAKLLGFGDMRGFMDELESVKDKDAEKRVQANMAKGKFTFRDLYTKFESMSKMGSLSKVMGMMPGMSGMANMMGGMNMDEKFKTWKFILDSFSDDELDGKVDIHTAPDRQKRIERIARGSGSHPAQVEGLLQQHKMWAGMVSKMGKSGLMGGVDNKQMKHVQEQMKRNPAMRAKAEEMARKQGINPDGGLDMASMMQGALGGGGGGMPDMARGVGGGGQPDFAALNQMMQNMGR
ncbi:hypothetical protein TrST_g7384 [Triparma strigata]|uniref:signal-recognition-particle GTPase n=1 Tax=Triparma strigata TaxID=1606541 RepID=A0A9W7E6D3_9STRA|nr:hypothetical protein TrST_g7384 [Triparma strigata]